jgi:hypothetical protein
MVLLPSQYSSRGRTTTRRKQRGEGRKGKAVLMLTGPYIHPVHIQTASTQQQQRLSSSPIPSIAFFLVKPKEVMRRWGRG